MAEEETEAPVIPPEPEAGDASGWAEAVETARQAPDRSMSALLHKLATRRVVGEGQPADAGLGGLGIVMQLGGGTFICLSAAMMLMGLVTPAPALLVLLGAIGIGRSVVHFTGGRQLMTGHINGLKPLRRYGIVGLVHSLVATALIVNTMKGKTPTLVTATVFLVLAAWPITTLLFSLRPSVRAVGKLSTQRQDRILPEDRGVQGMAEAVLVASVFAAITQLVILEVLPRRALKKG